MPASGPTSPAPEPAGDPRAGQAAGDAGVDLAHWESAYAALRELAAMRLASIPRGPTFQPTDVLHEAFVRILSANRTAESKHGPVPAPSGQADAATIPPSPPTECDPGTEAKAVATLAAAIRSVLVDRVRRRAVRLRHIENALHEPPDHADPPEQGLELLALDEGLTRLAGVDARAARVVELRYFAGLSNEHAATLLGISPATAERDWRFARAWLGERLGTAEPESRPRAGESPSRIRDASLPN